MLKKDSLKSIEPGLKKFLKACFVQPRKKLSRNISSIIPRDTVNKIFEELNIHDNVRPHEIDAFLYSQMYKKVDNYGRKQ